MGGANGFIKVSLSNTATSSLCGSSTFVELIGEFVVSLFGEIIREGASLSMEVDEEALAISGGGRFIAEMGACVDGIPSCCFLFDMQNTSDLWYTSISQKLKTQERLWQWDVGPSIDLNLLRCPLCDLVPDSHDHLFFECAFSSQVWSKVRVLCSMDSILPRLIDIITFISPISKGKTAVSNLSRLVLAATSYYIWLEKNGRLFKKKTSSSDQIVQVILSMVRLKLVTFMFKKMSTRSRLLLDQWKIPSYCIVHDGSSR
ncbi:reverse transcriptase domain, reverse transcriptase zinc-binding domain protein [Tanacetum coccineum]